MTLLELCEPIFQYICRLNRSARKGVTLEHDRTRRELLNLLDEARAKAQPSPELSGQYEKIEDALLFFIDFSIRESGLPFAGQWKDLAAEKKNELAGDEKFFDLLEEELGQRGPAADERLGVYYVCLGLGFTGWYAGQHEYLRKKMLEISARIGDRMDPDTSGRLCPEAYEHVNTADLVQPPGRSLMGMAIVLVGLLLVLLVANIYLYNSRENELRGSLERIAASGAPAVASGDEE